MNSIRRRAFMQGAAIGALAFSVGGAEVLMLPSEARAQGVPLKVLTGDEARRLEAVGEAMVPGARDAGIAHFVDQQCSAPSHEALLRLRISNWSPPFANFYRAALNEIDRQCNEMHGKPFAELAPAEQHAFIGLMRTNKLAGWKGPRAGGGVYAILRNDAVDVVYGTVEGFERLGVPYMPLVSPTARW
jgi:hypothetical protein